MYSFSYLEPVCYSMSSSNCCFLTCIQISQEAGQVLWCSHLFQNFPQFIVIHTVKRFGIINKADVFLELFCFFHDPTDVGNLISSSYGFSKTSLNIWKFTVHVLLKPGLENFEHFPTVFFSSIFLHWSLRKAFLSLLAIFWNSAFRCLYHSFSPLPFASLLFTAICKASPESHFAFAHWHLIFTRPGGL